MGLRFRKTFPLGSLLRLNLSKSSLSLGIGPRGLNINIGPTGIRRTIGLPGTGVFYQDRSGWSQIANQDQASTGTPTTEGGKGVSWISLIAIILGVIFVMKYCSTPDGAGTSSGSSVVSAYGASPTGTSTTTAISPKSDKPLSKDQIKELQGLLARGGFKPGAIDGVMGSKTKAAVRKFESSFGMTSTTEPNVGTLEKVRSRIGQRKTS